MKRTIVILLVLGLVLSSVASAAPASVVLVSRPGVIAYGPITGPLANPPALPPYAPGDAAWGEPKLAVAAAMGNWPLPINNPSIAQAVYISTANPTEPYSTVTYRSYHDELTLACTAYDIQAGVTLAASSDDAEWVYANGVLVGSNGVFNTIVNYAILVQPGTTMLDFVVRNNAGTSSNNPTGLAYQATVSYAVADVIWLPPVTLENFDLLDGSTVPLKFQLFQGETLLTAAQDVYMRVLDVNGDMVAEWVPGEGTDYLRFDGTEFYYIGNFHTKDYALAEGTYKAVVYDDCTDGALGQISFAVVPSQSRGGKK
jgi:hypothetical protein